MDEPLEIELKLEGEAEAIAAAPMFADDPGRTENLVSIYFDTLGDDLRKAGYSLRIRRIGKRRIQTIKADDGAAAGLFVRPEWERDVEGDTPVIDAASGPIEQIVAPDILAGIAPVFTTDVNRTTRETVIEGATIEVAVDIGAIRAGDQRAPVCEVELELKSGAPRALFDLARRLDEQVPLRLGVCAKSERGYALASGKKKGAIKAGPIAFGPGANATAAFATIARGCIRQFRLNEAVLLETGDPEPLHQARVGLRRLRSAFSLFKDLFEGDDRVPLLRAELKWLAATLGEVRNLDVLAGKVEPALQGQIAAARARAFEHVRIELASARTRLLMIDLAEWLMLGDWRLRPADPALAGLDAAVFAGDVLDRHRKRLKKRGEHLAKLDDHRRHEVRIEAKKLRYATEFFAALFARPKQARRHRAFLAALETMQDVLGELNDRVTGPEVLAALGIAAELPVGKQSREALLKDAADAHEKWADAKRFWR